jgi:hypothetical protein
MQNTKDLELIKSYIDELSNEDFKIFSDWFIASFDEGLKKSQKSTELKQSIQDSLAKFEELDEKEKAVDAEIQAHKEKLKAKGDPFADLL